MPNTREKLIGRLPIDDAILILREELKQRTDGYTTHLSYGGKGDTAEEANIDALEMAVAALERSKWISVKDRLPENDQYALCVMEDGSFRVFQWNYIDWMWNDGNEWWQEKDVTHWMELPQPPKGE